jgi:hypothetical protein
MAAIDRPEEVFVRLPSRENAPGFRDGFARVGMRTRQVAEDYISFARAEPVDEPYAYFTATRLCDRSTTLTDTTWAPLLEHPRWETDIAESDRIPDGDWQRALREHADRIRDPKRPESELASLKAMLMGTPIEDVPAFLTQQMTALLKAYPDGSLWFIRSDDLFYGRFTLMRMLATTELAPDYFDQYRPGEEANVVTLRDQSLSRGGDISKLIDPFLLLFSPATLGITLGWMPHTLVFLTGHTSSMIRDYPATPWALYDPGLQSSFDSPSRYADFIVDIPVGTIEAMLQWWVRRLNIVYSYLYDPTMFADEYAHFQPRKQLSWFLTFERMVADYVLIQMAFSGPELTRQQSAFDLLDKAESLLGFDVSSTGKGFERMLRRSSMLVRLEEVWQKLPLQARPRVRRWAQTLYDSLYEDVRRHSYDHRLTGGGVKVWSGQKNALVNIDLEGYVSQLVRAVRNSAHGFIHVLTSDDKQAGYDRGVLGGHDGRLPPEFPDIAALLAFALVADFERVVDSTWLPELNSGPELTAPPPPGEGPLSA